MIKAVFFDFDGVLTPDSTGTYTTCFNLHKLTGLSLEKILDCYKTWRHDLNVGEVNYAQIWPDFCACLGQELQIEVLTRAFEDTSLNAPMLRIVKELRFHYKVGIITDNPQERWELLVEKFLFKDLFDALICSAEVGSCKDDQKIFQVALDTFKFLPNEAVFIDNTKNNLDTAAQMGFQTIFYDDQKNDVAALVDELKKFQIKI